MIRMMPLLLTIVRDATGRLTNNNLLPRNGKILPLQLHHTLDAPLRHRSLQIRNLLPPLHLTLHPTLPPLFLVSFYQIFLVSHTSILGIGEVGRGGGLVFVGVLSEGGQWGY